MQEPMTTKQREDWLAQVRRGLLELCVLQLIDHEATYGYEIVTTEPPQQRIDRPLAGRQLWRLRRDGLLATQWRESDAGPPRQYYELTAAGGQHLEMLHNDWTAIVDAVRINLEPEISR